MNCVLKSPVSCVPCRWLTKDVIELRARRIRGLLIISDRFMLPQEAEEAEGDCVVWVVLYSASGCRLIKIKKNKEKKNF